MKKARLLIIDDDVRFRDLLADRLVAEGFQVLSAGMGAKGVELARQTTPHLILLDVRLPDKDGLEILKEIKAEEPKATVIMLTAHGTVETAVTAMKEGAYDFITKPFETDQLLLTINRALERERLLKETTVFREELSRQAGPVEGQSPAMRRVVDLARKVAESRATLLITGESGTGKQVLAQAIHAMSPRREAPFLQVNCGALVEQLLESDLFGHEKGAFTGAIKQKRGRLEFAHGGTVFLDEIGTLTPPLQAKLLHFLESGEFERVGGTQPLTVDTRIIAATNRDLAEAVDRGEFREDLYYRLNVIHLILPPLRDRREDLPLLAAYFLDGFCQETKKRITGIVPEAMAVLLRYRWPGNVRELRNVIERAVILATGPEILPQDLPAALVAEAQAGKLEPDLEDAVLHFRRQYILQTLERTGFNQTAAAKLLGISRQYLNQLVKELGLRPTQ